jgi:hypothetical protein
MAAEFPQQLRLGVKVFDMCGDIHRDTAA